MPIDRIVLEQLDALGANLPKKNGKPLTAILDVSTENRFNKIQDCLQEAAASVRSYRARFDDILMYV